MYNIHVCIEFSCVMQRAREAAVIVQAESDSGKASMRCMMQGGEELSLSGHQASVSPRGKNSNMSCTPLEQP